jgi:hypothetical protein
VATSTDRHAKTNQRTARIALRAVLFASQAADTFVSKEKILTTHEVLTSLLWLITGGYVAYVVWFAAREVKDHKRSHDG